MKTPPSLRLSLREIFLVTALVATGLGWFLDHRRVRELHEFMDFMDDTDMTHSTDPYYEYDTILSHRGQTFRVVVSSDVPAPPWPKKIDSAESPPAK